ncbi:MAG TPA: DUF2892 domain-containing protein [Minicystis sp.]|nr:DUF2892 domain-containing protein [Minicystis sp.]
MSINEGTLDRIIRVVLGTAIFALAFIGPKTVWGYLGLIPLVTGILGFCPVYRLFGFSTCPLAPPKMPS